MTLQWRWRRLAGPALCGEDRGTKRASFTRRRQLWAALASTLLVPGCQIVDQRTFQRAGLYPKPATLSSSDFASRAAPPPPLAVVRLGTNDNIWQSPLVAAARQAQQRKADVQFDLVAPIPTTASASVQDADARTGAADAARVAEVLQADGIDASRIHIGSRGDGGDPPREIEVYVR